MGYMGLGMQKWIYTMRPRKPFSLERKGSINTIPLYRRKFKIQPSQKSYQTFIGIAIILMFIIVTVAGMNSFMSYSHQINQEILENRRSLNLYAFEFLINSGKDRLKQGNYVGALSEFELALNIFPCNEKCQMLYFETISLLCENENKYCKKLDHLEF